MNDRHASQWALRALALACMVFAAGCTTVAQVTNLSQPDCGAEFGQGLRAILSEQGETAEIGQALADRTSSTLQEHALGPRPFVISAPSGTDYTFFVQKKADGCLLRLYGRQHGFVSYTNNLTYIATRPLSHCACAE